MSENYWEKFVDGLLETVGKALDDGTPARIHKGEGKELAAF